MDRTGLRDQEKLETITHPTIEPRQHNESPSQKASWPRWERKGKEKSSIARLCTWIVDHQISESIYRAANAQQRACTDICSQAYP